MGTGTGVVSGRLLGADAVPGPLVVPQETPQGPARVAAPVIALQRPSRNHNRHRNRNRYRIRERSIADAAENSDLHLSIPNLNSSAVFLRDASSCSAVASA